MYFHSSSYNYHYKLIIQHTAIIILILSNTHTSSVNTDKEYVFCRKKNQSKVSYLVYQDERDSDFNEQLI